MDRKKRSFIYVNIKGFSAKEQTLKELRGGEGQRSDHTCVPLWSSGLSWSRMKWFHKEVPWWLLWASQLPLHFSIIGFENNVASLRSLSHIYIYILQSKNEYWSQNPQKSWESLWLAALSNMFTSKPIPAPTGDKGLSLCSSAESSTLHPVWEL